MFRALLDRLSSALPSQCAICHAWPTQPLCPDCLKRHAPARSRCRCCALPVPASVDLCGACIKNPPPLDLCLAAIAYEYPWSGLIANYKFAPSPGWSSALATLMQQAPGAANALDTADWLLPVPLSEARLRTRGFNQAWELACRLAPAKTRNDILLRLRDTAAQSSLPLKQRLGNVKHAFGVAQKREPALNGRHLLLIDDVMTSGATLYAAATALRAAGAKRVSALVLARTA